MNGQIWYVYLLECADGSLYCGVTTNPERRVLQHNGHGAGGARYTRSRRPVVLRACAPCQDRSAALKLEHYLRTLPRHKKLPGLLHMQGATTEIP